MADQEDTKKPRKNYIEIVQRSKELSELARRAAENKAAETPVQMFLPGMDDFLRAMPNHIARSSLFAPVAQGRKKTHYDTVLVSRADAVIKFSGLQLDESQADVWMQIMHEAMKQPLGKPFVINRAAFLRSIGRNTSGANYQWLHRTIKDLAFGMLTIEATKEGKAKFSIGRTRILHMISGADYNEITETYTITIDPRWHTIHGNKEYALIDWDKRMQFGQHQNMAKAMQRLIATSNNPVQHYALDWLKDKMDYSGRLRDFKGALTAAMQELERLEIVTSWEISESTKSKEQLTIWLPSEAQNSVDN